MSPEIRDWWRRATQALESADLLVSGDPNGAASRAYFAAFAAVTALFSLEGKSFGKHTAVRAAVHRDLVSSGKWSPQLGKDFSELFDLRQTADYGGAVHVDSHQAGQAVEKARRILAAVNNALPPELRSLES